MQEFFACIVAILLKGNFVNIVLFILIWVQNPVITTTVTKWKAKKKNKEMDRNPRIAIQRLYLLNPWSHFLPFSERSTKEFDPIWWKREMQSFRVRIYEFMFKVLSSVKIWVVNELNGQRSISGFFSRGVINKVNERGPTNRG